MMISAGRERRSGRRIRFRAKSTTIAAMICRLIDPSRGGDRVRGTIDRPYPGTRFSPVPVSPRISRLSFRIRDRTVSTPRRYTAFDCIAHPLLRAWWHAPGRRAAGRRVGGVRRAGWITGRIADALPRIQLSGGQKAPCRHRPRPSHAGRGLLVLDETDGGARRPRCRRFSAATARSV